MKTILFVVAFFSSASALANPAIPFTESQFSQLTTSGQPVLVDIYAKWCGTCKKQSQVIAKYFGAHPTSTITVLRVDYDKQKDVVKRFKATRQSTLIAFHQGKEQSRLIAQTKQQTLFALLSAIDTPVPVSSTPPTHTVITSTYSNALQF
jgi:thioredoxin-like negative regulator of GroEL